MATKRQHQRGNNDIPLVTEQDNELITIAIVANCDIGGGVLLLQNHNGPSIIKITYNNCTVWLLIYDHLKK